MSAKEKYNTKPIDFTGCHPVIAEHLKRGEAIPRKIKRIMPPERAIPVLIAEGWRFDTSGQMDGPRQTILPAMFCSMGNRLDAPNTISWSWPPCIIEEVEDDE